MVVQHGSTLGIRVLTAQGLAGPRQELVFSKMGCYRQNTELQLWRPLNAGLAKLAQCGYTLSGCSRPTSLEPGCTDPSFSLTISS